MLLYYRITRTNFPETGTDAVRFCHASRTTSGGSQVRFEALGPSLNQNKALVHGCPGPASGYHPLGKLFLGP
jgi:hypothetical protein